METENVKKTVPKILIVDDIEMNVRILDNIISHEGYETLCALSVREAIDIIRKTRPTLILSDLSMPEVDGLEFCRMMKSDPGTREIPFIFISVLNTSEEKEQAFRAGAVDFIPKPFDVVEVIMRVNNQLNSYQLRREMADYNRRMHRLVEEQDRKIERTQENMLLTLAKIMKKRNPGLGGHLDRVGDYCRLLAQGLQFLPEYENEVTDEFAETIEVAAKLHEIGSLVLPDSACLRDSVPGERTAECAAKCAEEGAGLLEELRTGQNEGRFLSMAIRIVRYCHARWDGSGYPALAGNRIPLEARITVLASDFDDLMNGGAAADSSRVGERLSLEESIQRINEKSGVWYDPDIVGVFNKIRRRFSVD